MTEPYPIADLRARGLDALADLAREWWEERAAIAEFCGHAPRKKAEELATERLLGWLASVLD